jgi:uncharacterized protein
MKVYLDANILFSAAKSPGAIRVFVNELLAGGHELVADGYVIGEARRNLETKFPQALAGFEEIVRKLIIPAKLCPRVAQTLVPALAEKDRPVLAAAIEHKCDALVTGDKTHFGAFYGRTVQGVRIHSPASLAQSLAGGE